MCCDWYLTLPAAMLSLITTQQVFLQSIQSLLTFDLVLWETAYAQFVVIKTVFLWPRWHCAFLKYHWCVCTSIQPVALKLCKQTLFKETRANACFEKKKKKDSINKNMPLWDMDAPTVKAMSHTIQRNPYRCCFFVLFFFKQKRQVCKMCHANAKQGTLQ